MKLNTRSFQVRFHFARVSHDSGHEESAMMTKLKAVYENSLRNGAVALSVNGSVSKYV